MQCMQLHVFLENQFIFKLKLYQTFNELYIYMRKINKNKCSDKLYCDFKLF